jgi:[acyl-carrier-protein] S-malonyltransferase
VVTVLMCPGQGAQRVGMGKDLAERFPEARDVFSAIDEALDTRLSRLMWEGPEDELTLTHNAQPAILAHSVAVLAVVGKRLGAPSAGAGHSLGEYSAHVAAGTLSEVDAARLVRRRGELMLSAGKQRPGAMAAVLGLATRATRRGSTGRASGARPGGQSE